MLIVAHVPVACVSGKGARGMFPLLEGRGGGGDEVIRLGQKKAIHGLELEKFRRRQKK